MTKRRWVLKCKECRAECVYAEIRDTGVASFFLPKKPEVPTSFTYKCTNCGYKDTYDRTDILYQDDEIEPGHAAAKCG